MTNPLYALTDHDHTENERNKTMRKHSKTMSMGLMPTPYLVQLETFINPGLPYLSLIGFPTRTIVASATASGPRARPWDAGCRPAGRP